MSSGLLQHGDAAAALAAHNVQARNAEATAAALFAAALTSKREKASEPSPVNLDSVKVSWGPRDEAGKQEQDNADLIDEVRFVGSQFARM